MGSQKTEECALLVRHKGVSAQTSWDRRFIQFLYSFMISAFNKFTSRSWSFDEVSLKASVKAEENHLMNA